MQLPDRIHFFSYATGVSLELPVGFTPGASDAAGATYDAYDDDDASVVATLAVRVIGTVDDGSQTAATATAAVLDAMAARAGTAGQRHASVIDDEQVTSAVLRFPSGLPSGVGGEVATAAQGLLSSDLLMVFAAVAFGGALVSIAGMAPWAQADRYLPVFQEAVRSCRFIALAPVAS